MKNTLLALFTFLTCISALHAQEKDSLQIKIDSIENSFVYKTGSIELESGNAKLDVPAGFRFLDKEQSNYVLTNLWGNPEDANILGMLVPENRGVLQENSWAFTISYDNMGFVKDEDAKDINYDDLLKEQQKDVKESNPDRIKEGYESIQLINWASAPYYDENKKILHWAKELQFGEDSLHTLNYNLRILGRKGIFLLNAVATMDELPAVKQHLDKVINSVSFHDGHKYADFNPDGDEVAAWTVGGLVAGKVLAKAGFFAILLKFWKLIALGIAGGGAAIWKRFKGRKKEENPFVNQHTEA
ncbi:DUF2167 domain-containing protein [Flavihumibacter stibioxidans]|uniref:DUF2167 domain-containing protein n=1 Tax=Flavihumibacter stibioxidans TaxID=1834163 RepID=A0ABR7M6T0_9BACT|nr:DUF2167 domain-containing protein [Flavihumibacter stibioxidans]MBC6490723.1 hypothetical protein [Flavihumibacter stibioxidans]